MIISDEDGRHLLALARETLRESFKESGNRAASLMTDLDKGPFREKQGVFVTLEKKGGLRGCIGTIEPVKPILDAVVDNARHAAFHDTRFNPLTPDELKDVTIEISILTPPRKLNYNSAQDLVQRLRPGVDGVILARGGRRATFLPQVWDQLPTPESFLSQLCLKAGLSSRSWKSGDLEISIYQVRSFAEDERSAEDPKG